MTRQADPPLILLEVNRAAIAALVAASLLAPCRPAAAAPVLRAADVQVGFTSPASCEVSLRVTIEGAAKVEHRVEGRIELLAVTGARQLGDIRSIGRTESLVLQPAQVSYELRYRATMIADRAHRCPIWLPTVPADGQSRAVVLRVELPPGTVPGRSMPAFTWTGPAGTATLGHLPAFVHVPFVRDGEAHAWEIGRVMDGVALTVFAGASAWWVWRRKR